MHSNHEQFDIIDPAKSIQTPLYDHKGDSIILQGAELLLSDQAREKWVEKAKSQMNKISEHSFTELDCKQCKNLVENFKELSPHNFCLRCCWKQYVDKICNSETPVRVIFSGQPVGEENVQYIAPQGLLKITFGEDDQMYINGDNADGVYKRLRSEIDIKNPDPYQFNTDRKKRKPTIAITITSPYKNGNSYYKGEKNGVMIGKICESIRVRGMCISLDEGNTNTSSSGLPGIPGFGDPCIRHGRIALRDLCGACYNHAHKCHIVTTSSRSGKGKTKPKTIIPRPSPKASEIKKTLRITTRQVEKQEAEIKILKSKLKESEELVTSYANLIDHLNPKIERLILENKEKDIQISTLQVKLANTALNKRQPTK